MSNYEDIIKKGIKAREGTVVLITKEDCSSYFNLWLWDKETVVINNKQQLTMRIGEIKGKIKQKYGYTIRGSELRDIIFYAWRLGLIDREVEVFYNSEGKLIVIRPIGDCRTVILYRIKHRERRTVELVKQLVAK